MVVGGALAAMAGSWRSLLLGALGAALIVRGATGRCPIYRWRATRKGISVHRAITIQCAPSEVYRLWRDAYVHEAEILEDMPGQRLRWRVHDHEGTLELAEAAGGRGTVVEVHIVYHQPAAFLLRDLPRLELGEMLAQLRMLLETGEVATSASRSLAEVRP